MTKKEIIEMIREEYLEAIIDVIENLTITLKSDGVIIVNNTYDSGCESDGECENNFMYFNQFGKLIEYDKLDEHIWDIIKYDLGVE